MIDIIGVTKGKGFQSTIKKDSEQRNYQERPTEVLEELVALVLGIQPELDLRFQELVNWDIIIELK